MGVNRIKTKFFRICDCNNFITILLLKNNLLKKELNELDESIEHSKELSTLPHDTSKFKDEVNLKYSESRKVLIDSISKNENIINQYNKKINFISESINSLPEGKYKDILKRYYIDGESIKSITLNARCSRQTIYNLVHKIDFGV